MTTVIDTIKAVSEQHRREATAAGPDLNRDWASGFEGGVEAVLEALADHPDLLAAVRWHALNAALPRMMGSAGFAIPKGGSWQDATGMREDSKYLHAGIEFWTGGAAGYHGEERCAGGRRHLELIADQIIAQGGKALLFPESAK